MAASLLSAALIYLAIGPATASVAKDHPVVRVIGLLQGLKAKAEAEGFSEEQLYAKYEYWCKTSKTTLDGAIADGKAEIDSLEIAITGYNEDIKVLSEQVAELSDSILEMTTSADKADKLRSDTAATYQLTSDNLKLTIKAIKDSLELLKTTKADQVTAEASFAQISSVEKEQVRKILALLRSRSQTIRQPKTAEDLSVYGDMEKHVDKYEFKSGGVVELLKQLLAQFEGDLVTATAEETNSMNNHATAALANSNAKAAAEKSKEEKEATIADTNRELEKAKGEKKTAEEDLASDYETKSKTVSACNKKAAEWDERSKTRADEIAAMDAAVAILSKVTGVRTKPTENPVVGASPLSLLQIARHPHTKAEGYEVLRLAAIRLKSHALERLAVEVFNNLSGPFDKVINMIQKMIFHLNKEQLDEDEHKDWCDKELSKTALHIKNRDDAIAISKATINELTAEINKLTQEITTATEMIAKLNAFMAEATEIREIGKKENSISLTDAEDAETAVANAIAVLTAFYKESGMVKKEAWELLQEPVTLPANPATWDSSYTGVADPENQPSGIITVLKKVQEDFTKMQAETKAQEAEDQKDYDETMRQHKVALAERTQEVKEKEAQKSEASEKLKNEQTKLKRLKDELESWTTYQTNLQPACVDGDSTYEERKGKRAQEIAALKEAQGILADAFNQNVTNATFVQSSPPRFLQIHQHTLSN